MKNHGADTILRAVINPLRDKHLNPVSRRAAACLVAALACSRGTAPTTTPAPAAPLPTFVIAAQQVGITPLTLIALDDSLHWQALVGERRAALAKGDSVIGSLLKARAPEVQWLLPDDLRRAARRAPGMAPDPDRMGTAILLRPPGPLATVPDPLRSELRTLAALVGSGGGRYVLVPAAVVFRRPRPSGDAPAAAALPQGVGTAELTVALVDVRTGRVGFHTVARGEGDDPWTALTRAVKSLTPGLP